MTTNDNLAKARAAKAAAAAAKRGTGTDEPVTAAGEAPEPVSEPIEGGTIALATEEHVDVPHTPKPDAMPAKAAGERVVEVELLKPYTPEFLEDDMGRPVMQGEVKAKLPKGSVIKLPASEATRALRLQIAVATANTFA